MWVVTSRDCAHQLTKNKSTKEVKHGSSASLLSMAAMLLLSSVPVAGANARYERLKQGAECQSKDVYLGKFDTLKVERI